jgi:DNA polymerase-3 subunit gamma/tau
MAYQVIARKWRPQTFADVVGQEHVTRTLQNQLLTERTAHAYLFVGPRGIGKTTIARIFAKALNCVAAPVADPCGRCPNCLAITDGSSLDVIEIDGASNNSVDDVRRLREEVMYTPVSCRFKVYIIDEIHMLSTSAWNALLKTVEEPPAHVKFIFATTEAHKVLATIVSRCQRFDLRRLTTRIIRDHLRRIAVVEKVEISDAALAAIARAADGGMRDGQSLLDQMISFFSGQPGGIAEDQVLRVFGLTGAADLERLAEGIVTNRPAAVVGAIHALTEQGKNLERLFDEVLTMLRGVQVCHLSDRPEDLLDEPGETIASYRRLAATIATDRLQLLLENLAPAGRVLHDALNKQVYLETILLKAMRLAHGVQLSDIILRLNEIRTEGSLEVLTHVPAATPPPAIPPSSPSPAAKATTVAPAPPPPPGVPATQATPSVMSAPAPEPPAPPPVAHRAEAEAVIPEPTPSPALSVAPVVPPETARPRADAVPPPPVPPAKVAAATAPPPATAAPALPPAAAPRAHQPPAPDVLWHLLIQDMNNYADTKGFLKAHMQAAKPESFADDVLTVIYDEEFEEIHIEELRRHLPFLNKCLARVGGGPKASIDIRRARGVGSAHDEADHASHLRGVRERVEKNEFVQTVMDLFDGEIVQVRG